MNKFLTCLVLLSQAVYLASAQGCALTCASNQVLDYKKCTCLPKMDCLLAPRDPIACDTLSCDTSASTCPRKCYCDVPSAMNNCCYPCLNNGVVDPATCKCTCAMGWQGPRCQFPVDVTTAVDDPTCANVNCYNATDVQFFSCPNKCLTCDGTTVCQNYGSVTPTCTCQCVGADPTIYNPTDCSIANCIDNQVCKGRQFRDPATSKLRCDMDTVKYNCPLSCGVCV